MPDYHAAGQTKVVRAKCFAGIGGFVASRGWDTVDEIKAQALGWKTCHFEDLSFLSSEEGRLRNRVPSDEHDAWGDLSSSRAEASAFSSSSFFTACCSASLSLSGLPHALGLSESLGDGRAQTRHAGRGELVLPSAESTHRGPDLRRQPCAELVEVLISGSTGRQRRFGKYDCSHAASRSRRRRLVLLAWPRLRS